MKTEISVRRPAGFSLIELVTAVILLGAVLSVTVVRLSAEERLREDKRNAQAILQSYSVGVAARVPWPKGDVATVAAAMMEGRTPREGAFADRVFLAPLLREQVRRTFRYLGRRPDGGLYFDPTGGQDPDGR